MNKFVRRLTEVSRQDPMNASVTPLGRVFRLRFTAPIWVIPLFLVAALYASFWWAEHRFVTGQFSGAILAGQDFVTSLQESVDTLNAIASRETEVELWEWLRVRDLLVQSRYGLWTIARAVPAGSPLSIDDLRKVESQLSHGVSVMDEQIETLSGGRPEELGTLIYQLNEIASVFDFKDFSVAPDQRVLSELFSRAAATIKK